MYNIWQAQMDQYTASVEDFGARYDYYKKIADAGVTATSTAADVAFAKDAASTASANRDESKRQYIIAKTSFDADAAASAAADAAALPTSTIKTPDQTNPSQSDAETARLMAQGNQPGDGSSSVPTADSLASNEVIIPSDPPISNSTASDDRVSRMIANKTVATQVVPKWGNNDHRARLRVPSSYLVGPAAGPNGELRNNGGVIFPYTPNIGQEYKADYASQNVMHFNYTPKFYKGSSVSDITLTAKFSVQNETEACIFLATMHLLRVLTKMKFGDDDNAGSPPPICRLMALGDFGFDNAPVAIGSVKLDFNDAVDYIETGNTIKSYGRSFVPVMSTISLSLIPIYSRNEMQKFTVKGWLDPNSSRLKGYL